MSHITYLPTGKKGSLWKKCMTEMLRRMPRSTYKETVSVKDKSTGLIKEKIITKRFSDRDIKNLVTAKWISGGDYNKSSTPTADTDSDIISKKFYKNFEKIKKSDKKSED